MLGKKMNMDTNIFDNQNCNNFMKMLYSLKFTQMKLHKFPKADPGTPRHKGSRRKKKMSHFMRIVNKFLCFGFLGFRNSQNQNPVDFLKNKNLELIVDFKMKYDFPDISDVLLGR